MKHNPQDMAHAEPRGNGWAVVVYGIDGDQLTVSTHRSIADAQAIAAKLGRLIRSWTEES